MTAFFFRVNIYLRALLTHESTDTHTHTCFLQMESITAASAITRVLNWLAYGTHPLPFNSVFVFKWIFFILLK
jgi:hypothetical protein